MAFDDDPGGTPQREAASVVTETLPRTQDIGRRGRGERLDRREPRHEALPVLGRARGLRLLGHELGHEDRVRIVRSPERQRPSPLPVPGQDALACSRRHLGWTGHVPRIAAAPRRLSRG